MGRGPPWVAQQRALVHGPQRKHVWKPLGLASAHDAAERGAGDAGTA